MQRKHIEEKFFEFLMIAATFVVFGALLCILATVIWRGMGAISLDMLTKTPQGGYYLGKEGGVLNAILGSLYLATGATVIAFVFSLAVALYLNVYVKKDSKFALIIRTCLDTLWGIPSIVYGAFGFAVMVFLGLKTSLLAGMITVAFLIFPIMTRSMDEVFKMLPAELAEASFALGSTKLETALHVMLRQALPGIITAVLLAFCRGIGDAASVLFTAGFTDSLPHSLFKPVATLPLAIFFQLGTPFPEVQQRGYASALILTAVILAISILIRVLSRKFSRNIVR